MSSLIIASIAAASTLTGGLLGMGLQTLLPSHHLTKEMQDLVKLSAGTIATLTALVLGLLVSSAKTSFDSINTGIVQGGANVIFLDRTLARYGPETRATRDQLKVTVETGIETIWPAEKSANSGLTVLERRSGMEDVQDMLSHLMPQTDNQRAIFAQAQQLASTLAQARWLLIEETHSGIPFPLLAILIFWLVLLFVSFGLFAPKNLMAVVVLAVGACAISAAIFLVLELNEPFDGLIKASSAPLRNALEHLGK